MDNKSKLRYLPKIDELVARLENLWAAYGKDMVTECAREQIDTIFYRYAKYSGMDVSKSDDLSRFSAEDVAKISDWALPAVKWAVAVGLMEGRGNSNGDPNSLDPRDATTRAEAAALLYRWCEEPLK